MDGDADDEGDDAERWEIARTLHEFWRGLSKRAEVDDETSARVALGLAYVEMGLLEDATAELAKALERDPTNPAAEAGLKLIRRAQNEDE